MALHSLQEMRRIVSEVGKLDKKFLTKAAQTIHGRLVVLPKGEKLHPYRSVVAWYCYQAVHESRGLDY